MSEIEFTVGLWSFAMADALLILFRMFSDIFEVAVSIEQCVYLSELLIFKAHPTSHARALVFFSFRHRKRMRAQG